jgi:hypothetical protein
MLTEVKPRKVLIKSYLKVKPSRNQIEGLKSNKFASYDAAKQLYSFAEEEIKIVEGK